MKNEKSRSVDKNKAIYVSVITILIVIFVVIFVYGLNKVLAMEGQFPPIVNSESLTPAPESAGAAVSMLGTAYNNAAGMKPKVERKNSVDIDKDSIETDGSAELGKTVSFIADSIEDRIEEYLPESETDFGEDIKDLVSAPVVSAGDITDHAYFKCDVCGMRSDSEPEECEECGSQGSYSAQTEQVRCYYVYYKCRSCGETCDVPRSECEKCGSVYPYDMYLKDDYEITAYIGAGSVPKVFENLGPEEVKEITANDIDGFLTVDSLEITPVDARIFFKVERTSDRLDYLEYFRKLHITAKVTFTGDFDAAGSKTVSFDTDVKNKYSFTWPGLELNRHEMSVEPKATDNLLATLTCTDPTQPVVTWTSSDENLFTVDEDGYIKAGKNEGSGTVTASFEFNGVTYTDSCTVNVRYSVESLKVSQSKLKLNAGDTFKLTAAVSPKKATVQTVTWHSADESVAKVDENGVVTAVAAGKTTVFAVSDDEFYKSSCEVSVN